MANKSAPGSSGIGWSMLKKGWEAVKDHLILAYNSCLFLGCHGFDGMTLDSAVMTTQAEKYH
jgi:hypothetical protein